MTDLLPGMEGLAKRAPKKKTKIPFPRRWTRKEKLRIKQFCERKTPRYLPADKPGHLNDIMSAMRIHYTVGEGAHVWRRNWVATAYNWLLQQNKIDFRNAQRHRPGPGSVELPQMARAEPATEGETVGKIMEGLSETP